MQSYYNIVSRGVVLLGSIRYEWVQQVLLGPGRIPLVTLEVTCSFSVQLSVDDFFPQASVSLCLMAFSSFRSMLDESENSAQEQSSITEGWNGVGGHMPQPPCP